jgi:hypothetical protein
MYTIAPVHLLFEHISTLNSLTRRTVHIPEIIYNADLGEMYVIEKNYAPFCIQLKCSKKVYNKFKNAGL